MVIKLLVCGGGNGAHVLAGLAASQEDVDVRVLTLFADEPERWTAAMESGGFTISRATDTVTTKPFLVTRDPEAAMAGVDLVVLVVPAFAHYQYLNYIAAYVKPGMALIGLPGQAGFEFAVRGVLGDIVQKLTLISFESLPWACRINEFGKNVQVLGTKDGLNCAVQGHHPQFMDPIEALQKCVGQYPVLKAGGHLLGITLNSMTAYVHPAFIYSTWRDWDGVPVNEPPLFYHGLDEKGAAFLELVCDEVMDITRGVARQQPSVDLTHVMHLFPWLLMVYKNDIRDKTSLYTVFRTNGIYEGLKHPVKATADGKWVPDFSSRYISEDIPFGLVVFRGIAEIAGVPTPNIDELLYWCQSKLNKEYLVDGKLTGKDVVDTRAPQRYGCNTLEEVTGESVSKL